MSLINPATGDADEMTAIDWVAAVAWVAAIYLALEPGPSLSRSLQNLSCVESIMVEHS